MTSSAGGGDKTVYSPVVVTGPSLPMCGMSAKIVMITINFLLFCAAGFLVGVCVYMVIEEQRFSHLGLGTYILVAGVAILMLAFLGCCGAVCNEKCLLWPYMFLLMVLLVAEIALVAVTMINKNHLKGILEEVWDELDFSAQADIMFHDGEYVCCGFDGPPDGYDETVAFRDSEMLKKDANGSNEQDVISLMAQKAEDDGKNIIYHECVTSSTPSPPTCWDKYHDEIERNLKLVIIILCAIAGTKILLLIATCILINRIGVQEVAKEVTAVRV